MIVRGLRCPKCDDVIWSRSRHDYRHCSCGAVMIDGGRDYTRYGWNPEIGRQPLIKLDISDASYLARVEIVARLKEVLKDHRISQATLDQFGALLASLREIESWLNDHPTVLDE